MDYSSLGSSVQGILQAIILEWVAMPSSRASSLPRDGTLISYISCIDSLFFTTGTNWNCKLSSMRGEVYEQESKEEQWEDF